MAEHAILRAIHILAGAAWAGTIFFLVFVVGPALRRSPEAGRFMQQIAPRFPAFFGGVAALNVLSGVGLYWRDSNGFRGAWILSPMGLTFTLGAMAAIAAGAVGGAVLRPAGEHMETLGRAVTSGTATRDQAAQLGAIQRRTAAGSIATAALMTLAVVAMACARYV
jgi:hypothetical protein